jgi:hypothetical protein
MIGSIFLGALQSGHLAALKLISDLRWGALDPERLHIEPTYALVEGAMKFGDIGFFDQVARLLAPRADLTWAMSLVHYDYLHFLRTIPDHSLLCTIPDATVAHLADQALVRIPDRKLRGQCLNERLRYAARYGMVELVRVFLRWGASPDAYDTLWQAANRGHYSVVRVLVEAGAKVDKIPGSVIMPSHVKKPFGTPLSRAIASENESICMYLIQKGAQVDLVRSSSNIIQTAATEGLQLMVDMVLHYAAHVSGTCTIHE